VSTVSGVSVCRKTFVIEEKEEFGLEDGAAEVHAVLVAIEGALFEWSDGAGVADDVGLEEPGCVQVSVCGESRRGVA